MSKLAILWDLDGTLADSEPYHTAAAEAVLAELNLPDARKTDDLIGFSRAKVHAYLQSSYEGIPEFAEYSDALDRCFMDLIDQVKPVAASVNAIRRFAAQGRGQRIVSNSVPQIASAIIDVIGIADLGCGLSSCDGSYAPKPAADPYLHGLQALGISANQAIAVEDSIPGCASARAAGLFVVGVGPNCKALEADLTYAQFPADTTPEQLLSRAGK